MSGTYNIDIYKGADFNLGITIKDSSGIPINLSGYSGCAGISYSYGLDSNFASFDVDILTAESGILALSMSNTNTSDLPATQARYELNLIDSDNNKTKYLNGYVNIYPQIGCP